MTLIKTNKSTESFKFELYKWLKTYIIEKSIRLPTLGIICYLCYERYTEEHECFNFMNQTNGNKTWFKFYHSNTYILRKNVQRVEWINIMKTIIYDKKRDCYLRITVNILVIIRKSLL